MQNLYGDPLVMLLILEIARIEREIARHHFFQLSILLCLRKQIQSIRVLSLDLNHLHVIFLGREPIDVATEHLGVPRKFQRDDEGDLIWMQKKINTRQ